MLELDYTNVLEQTVHNHGIPKIAFQKAADSSKHVVEAIHQAHTSGKLGFGDLPADQNAVKTVIDFARSHAYPNVLLLGIGGSALGPAALEASLNRPHSVIRRSVLNSWRSLQAQRLVSKALSIPRSGEFPTLDANCLIKIERLVSVLPMAKSRRWLARLVLRLPDVISECRIGGRALPILT